MTPTTPRNGRTRPASAARCAAALALGTACLALLAPAAQAGGSKNLILNGSFGQPDTTPGVQAGSALNWYSIGNVQRTVYLPGTGDANHSPGYSAANGGTSAIVFNSGASGNPGTTLIDQQIQTTLGTTYDVSFDYGKYGPTTGDPQSLSVYAYGNNPPLLLDQVTDDTGTPYDISSDPTQVFSHYSCTFVGDGAMDTLVFADSTLATHGGESNGALDNVAVYAAPVPELSSAAGLSLPLLGLAGLALARRRRGPAA